MIHSMYMSNMIQVGLANPDRGYRFSIPRQASAEDREAGLWSGIGAVLVLVVLRCGLEVILGVTTAGEPGPRSIRLSSVASFRT